MRKMYDLVIIGSGPSGLTLLDRYSKNNRNARRLLVTLESVDGAFTKGTKAVHPIIPKLPIISINNIVKYDEILRMKELAEILLKEQFRASSAYLGDSSLGIRYCRSSEEFETLRSVNNLFYSLGASISEQTAAFLNAHFQRSVDRTLLFAYKEHLWNISQYMDIFLAKIGRGPILRADTILYRGNTGSAVELVILTDGRLEVIHAARLIVCLGIGNIEFERKVREYRNDFLGGMGLNVLTYYKCVYSKKPNLPTELSSIIIPDDGLCITNELSEGQSIMYNTNSSFCPEPQFNQEFLDSCLHDSQSIIARLYPLVYQSASYDFVCPMPVDRQAYHDKPQNHFRFIISPSVDSSVRYFNLPYFTAITAAVNALSADLNYFE